MKKDGKLNDCKMVGVWLPLPIYNYITLHSLIRGKKKSAIIRTLITEWYVDNKALSDFEQLKTFFEHTVQEEWNSKRVDLSVAQDNFENEFALFKINLKNELEKRFNETALIDEIVSKLTI